MASGSEEGVACGSGPSSLDTAGVCGTAAATAVGADNASAARAADVAERWEECSTPSVILTSSARCIVCFNWLCCASASSSAS